MSLFEIVRWGNESDDPLTGGPDGPDTCFLVRAATLEAAVALVDVLLSRRPSERVRSQAQLAYLIGEDAGTDATPRILRGPYLQSAYNHGWRQWMRDDDSGLWCES